jgi:hypothetical protein
MWFKVDDTLPMNPKVMQCSLSAIGLWTLAGAWSSQQLTDGFIPKQVLEALSRGASFASELVASGLWVEVPGGYQFHDWGQYQPLASEVKTVREKRAESGRKGGLASGRSRREASASSKTEAKSNPVPSRPVLNNYPSADADASPRTDVKEIIDYLDDAIRESGQKLPGRTKKNLEAARLLLDKDHRTVQQVKNCVDFTFQDEFWRTNIRSMSKLREKWVQLEGAAARAKTRMKPAVPTPENDPYAWMQVVSS